jgi:cytoskeletal protein CcmA (bactofilin family)
MPPPLAATAPTVSVIDANSTFDGRFESQHDLRVEGVLSGEVVCRGVLTVEREATLQARVEARDARILGRFDGELACTGRLSIGAGAIVSGTLKAAVVAVEEGAVLTAQIETAPAAATRPLAAHVRPEGVVTRARPAAAPPTDDDLPVARNGSAAFAGRLSRPRETPTFTLVGSDEQAVLEHS